MVINVPEGVVALDALPPTTRTVRLLEYTDDQNTPMRMACRLPFDSTPCTVVPVCLSFQRPGIR